MKDILFSKNTILVFMLIVPLLLLLFCHYKTNELNQIEHFRLDDNSIKNVFKKLFGLNKTDIKGNVVTELDNNINQLNNITNSIDTVNNNLGNNNSKNNNSVNNNSVNNNSVNSDSVNNNSVNGDSVNSDSVNSDLINGGSVNSDSVNGGSTSSGKTENSSSSNLNVGFDDFKKKSNTSSVEGNQNNRDINSIVSTKGGSDISKIKPKEMPLLNITGGLQKFNNNVVKGDFQKNSDKCKFFGGKCPNGYTRFGTFQVINNSILNGEKLICDNSISKNNESCAYCCKQ